MGSVSNKGLAKILSKVKEVGHINTCRSSLNDVNLEYFLDVRHVEELECEDGSMWSWEFAEPNMVLAKLVSESEELTRLYSQAARMYPCTADRPWQMIVGFDEYAPGAKLKPHNNRKVMVLSFTFLELGRDALWEENCWVTPVAVRHSHIVRVKGGWSHMLAKYLTCHLLGAQGVSTAGVPLMLNGQPFLLFAKLKFMLADMEGHKQALSTKGASGLRPCALHHNVLSKDSDLVHRDQRFVEISCAEPDRFQRSTSTGIYEIIDTLQQAAERVSAGTLTKTRFEQMQKAFGYTWCPSGLLTEQRLRQEYDITTVLVFDWMHTTLSDGTLTIEAFLLVQSCDKMGITLKSLEDFMRYDWIWPAHLKAKNKYVWQVFQTVRAPQQDKLKCSASELLALYSLLRHFVETRIAFNPAIDAKCASFQAVCRTIDIIKQAKNGSLPMRQAGAELRAAVSEHMSKHVIAYGDSHIKPKHHYMYDICDQFGRNPAVIDAFIIERLHLRVKAVADPICCTTTFERSVLASLLTVQRRTLNQHGVCRDGLKGTVGAVPGQSFDVADRLQIGGMTVTVDDIVLSGIVAGKVVVCARQENDLLVLAKRMNFVGAVSTNSGRWQLTEQVVVWRALDLKPAMTWQLHADSNFLVVYA